MLINLVTGGSGFIGSNLIDRLINNGEFVLCLDDFSSGKIENIKKFLSNKKFQFFKKDITNSIELNIKIDRIWHLACPGSPTFYQLDPIKTCLLYTSPSPRDNGRSRMPSSA